MLQKFSSPEKEITKIFKAPKHIGITTNGTLSWAINNDSTFSEAFSKSFDIIKEVIDVQISQNIPIITFLLMSEETRGRPTIFSQVVEVISSLFDKLIDLDILHENRIKVSVLGKWYDLPSKLVDSIKAVLEKTKDYDQYFVNLCINYDGNEEIVDACKLIARQISSEKIDVDAINKDLIKENLYSSYFLPPDIIIKNGRERTTASLLLWDSGHCHIFFTDKNWPDFERVDLMKAITEFCSQK